MSKYELNSEVFKLAQRKDDIGVLAQFCLQIERESISADDKILKMFDDMTKQLDIEIETISNIRDTHNDQGIEVDDIKVDIEELKENKNDKGTKFNN